jgi:D-amino-acid dehydrogenase
VANGVHAQQIGQQLKDKLNIYPVKGYSITIDIDALSRPYCPTVSLLDDEAKIVTSTLGNQLRVAGTAELDGYNRDIRRERIEPLLNWVEKNFPGINTRNYTSWACLRPMTPDMMPIVRRSQNNSKVWYHCGHGHLGWTLSLATANELVKQIQDDKKIRMVS